MNTQLLASATAHSPDSVVVIDDDLDMRESLGRLLRSVGLQPRLFGSVAAFVESALPDGPTCLVLDVRLPGRSGLDFQRDLAAANVQLPIIFITGHGDIPMSVQAMKAGAIEFLTKPSETRTCWMRFTRVSIATEHAVRMTKPSVRLGRE